MRVFLKIYSDARSISDVVMMKSSGLLSSTLTVYIKLYSSELA